MFFPTEFYCLLEIFEERERQLTEEGWTAEHDDAHDDGQLMRAAMIYLWHGTDYGAPIVDGGIPMSWPWAAKWWKPRTRRRNLERAGALMLAEAARLKRKTPAGYVGHVEQKFWIVVRELASLGREAA